MTSHKLAADLKFPRPLSPNFTTRSPLPSTQLSTTYGMAKVKAAVKRTHSRQFLSSQVGRARTPRISSRTGIRTVTRTRNSSESVAAILNAEPGDSSLPPTLLNEMRREFNCVEIQLPPRQTLERYRPGSHYLQGRKSTPARVASTHRNTNDCDKTVKHTTKYIRTEEYKVTRQ